jgi:hypothetical protein
VLQGGWHSCFDPFAGRPVENLDDARANRNPDLVALNRAGFAGGSNS